MKTSPQGRALLAQREGRRLTAYRDSKGVLTIGVGHTGRMSPPPVTPGMTITEAESDTMLAADLAPVEAAIATSVKVPLSQNEFDALVSLGFNIGTSALSRSTVVKRLNLGDIAGAAQAFLLWSKPAVLTKRRREEMTQFLTSSPSQGVAAARAATLESHAQITKAKAQGTRAGAAALAGASLASFATPHAHHPVVGLVCGGLLIVGAALAIFVTVAASQRARLLDVNAAMTRVGIGNAAPNPSSPNNVRSAA